MRASYYGVIEGRFVGSPKRGGGGLDTFDLVRELDEYAAPDTVCLEWTAIVVQRKHMRCEIA
jgi:hypothetical protein